MKQYGPQNAKLLFTDTDSLTYLIATEDVYQDMKKNQELYDTSNFPKDHFLFSNENKKVIGEFKDETGGLPITEWVGLRAKMYSFLTENNQEKKTGKGIKKSVLKKEIKHQDFKDCLFKQREYQHSMTNFRSEHHQMYTIKQFKKSLSPFDDKRYILEDGYSTRAHGHYENGILRPSEASKVSGLIDAMKGLSLSKEQPKSDMELSTPKSDKEQSVHSIIPPLAPLPSDIINTGFHSYLTSFWK